MATQLLLSKKLLRRCPRILTAISSSLYSYSSTSSSWYTIICVQSSNRETSKSACGLPLSTLHPLPLLHNFVLSRSLSTLDSECGRDLSLDSATPPEEETLSGSGFSSATAAGDADGSGIAEALFDIDGDGEPILPVRALISLLDLYHDSSGWPWWVVIASSTLALRIALLPVLILQLQKAKKIAESLPRLPSALPPPLSGRSYIDQFILFRMESKANGCPSLLWLLAYISVQTPCFFLWMATVRRMSLDHHPGFDCGGTLWFQNLTELPHGVTGFIFPLLVGSLHFVNIQISFQSTSIGRLGLLGQYFKNYLNMLTLPILISGFCVPQGSLVYWVMNGSVTLVQQLFLKAPAVCKYFGLPDKVGPVSPANHEETDTPEETQDNLLRKQQEIQVQHLSPRELLALSVKRLAKGRKDGAMTLLRLALDKDPEYVRALIVLGQTLLQDGQLAEAEEYFKRAISKISLIGHPTEVEEVDHLILASQWAGIACIRQGRNPEGIKHLERITNLKEPEDAKSKAHYYDGFLILSSALYNEGRKPEAVNLLRMCAAYDSSYNVWLEQCEKDEVDLVSDLVGSRRRDY